MVISADPTATDFLGTFVMIVGFGFMIFFAFRDLEKFDRERAVEESFKRQLHELRELRNFVDYKLAKEDLPHDQVFPLKGASAFLVYLEQTYESLGSKWNSEAEAYALKNALRDVKRYVLEALQNRHPPREYGVSLVCSNGELVDKEERKEKAG